MQQRPEEILEQLIVRGYSIGRAQLPEGSLSQIQRVAEDLTFTRVPADFEPSYLGKESREKTVLIDLELAEVRNAVSRTPVETQDSSFSSLFGQLQPLLKERLDLRVTSRTNLLLRQTFADADEEAAYPAPSLPSNSECETMLSLLKRRRVCVMSFVGPRTGRLVLSPTEGGADVVIEAAPGSLVIFLTQRFRYSYTCTEGATLILQTWFLSQQPQFVVTGIGGDLSLLGSTLEAGPQVPTGESVAVQGMSTYLGCDSKDYLCYWLMFNKAGGDTFVEVPLTRWDLSVYSITTDMQAAQAAGLAYIRHQGYVDGIEFFDSRFFGISNTEASSMDPNQRKTLECCYECVSMGGYELKSLQRDPKNIGVFVGISGSEWSSVPHPMDAAGCGGAEAIISNRCNFSLNLKGASQTINTACSSGLVAMHTGKLHLKYKAYDPMDAVVAIGCQMAYSPVGFIGCCSGGMLSFRGRCFTFDVGADGYGRGEGCSGVLMTLTEYSREVFALVAGSQANQDGRSASITAPNGPSQEKCIKAVFREASIRPPEVDCFECHGTGTALGDPIEVGAFKRIYNNAHRETSLLVTSSKTNLGHLEGGAGMAGFIKCCLQVMKCESSPNLHLRETNPHLDTDGFPAQFISEGLVTSFDSAYTGVSSFGFGGTNAHALAFGKNIMTTRRMDNRDYRSIMLDRILKAAPCDIIKTSNNPEEWESTGKPISEDAIGKTYQVEMSATGSIVWREVLGTATELVRF